jgi:hypothetical protein
MASIRQRGERWHVQIRRQGTSFISKIFTTKTDAKAWALQTEALVGSGGYQKAAHNLKTLECLLLKYRDEISLKKKGASSETYRINHMLTSSMSNPLGSCRQLIAASDIVCCSKIGLET